MRLAAARAFDAAPASWSLSLSSQISPGADVVVLCPEIDLPDDAAIPCVRFDPDDLPAALEGVGLALRNLPVPMLPVVSPSGGCGTTTLALHLAREFGHDTAYVELDPLGGSSLLDRFGLDVTTEAERSGPFPIAGFHALVVRDRAAVPGAVAGYKRAVVDVARHVDFTPAALSLCVISHSVIAARRASRLIRSHPQVQWVVVSNRLCSGGETTSMEIQTELGRAIDLRLPFCPALRDAEATGSLMRGSWRRWQRGVARLAVGILRATESQARPRG